MFRARNLFSTFLLLACLTASATTAQEIGYVEDFALADDRTAALEQLIPGTEAYYYYHCLHYQNTGAFDRIPALLESWIKRHGNTTLTGEIQFRQAVLTYDQSPEQSLEFLRRELGLNFNHQRQVLDHEPDLATELSQQLISRDAFLELARQRYTNTDGLTDSGLEWFIDRDLTPVQRRHLLERLQRPDHAGLVKLIADELVTQGSRGFGSLTIHRNLTKSQLEELLRMRPALATDTNYVYLYLRQLQPNPDVDWRSDDDAYKAYLESLWAFVADLAPVFNSLKAHVLYHRLAFDYSHGVYNRDRFMTYLALPRQVSYINPDYLRELANRQPVADLNANYESQTMLPPIFNDEPLVRDYFQHFFKDDESFQPYTRFVRDTYVKSLFAETKIVNGIGDQEQWYSMLSPAEYQALKDRVDIEFLATNKSYFAAQDPVTLQLAVKNVSNLIVKVFEINTENYYRKELSEISTDINLDGLVANDERMQTYDEPALRRVVRTFEFPQLKNPGVYVVDFIGNGKSSRVVIRKGKLRHLVRNTIAGQTFTILNERNEKLSDAVLWMGGREYHPDDNGEISVPYSTSPGRQPIVLSHQGLSTLDYFQHEAESYQLTAGFYVDREELIRRNVAEAVVRTGLQLAGTPVSVKLLEDIKLKITSTDLEGVTTTRDIDGFEVFDEKESTFEFQVPDRLASLQIQMTAKVKSVSENKRIDLNQSQAFHINEIDRQPVVEDLHFHRSQEGYFLELRGKSGEPKAGRAIQLQLHHTDFTFPRQTVLQTDPQGRVRLGPLEGITSVQAMSPDGISTIFETPDAEYAYRQTVQGNVGETFEIPYLGEASEPKREEISLFEVKQGAYVSDRFDSVAIQDGMIVIRDLPRGDFELRLKKQNHVTYLRVAEGPIENHYALGPYRQLEVRGAKPFHIVSSKWDGEKLIIQTANATSRSRVHLFATQFVPPFSAFNELSRIRDAEPYTVFAPDAKSLYVAGRKIGDEYQYILDRRYARKYPGNMLERPSLLLNPWVVNSTATDRQDAKDGGNFDRSSQPAPSESERKAAGEATVAVPTDYSNLDFLASPAAVLINLVPDDNGMIEIDAELLGPYHQVKLVGIDPSGTATRNVFLEEVSPPVKDLRLANGLDPQGHFTQQKQITVLHDGDTLTIDDLSTARFEAYTTLADVYRLYLSLTGNTNLAEFNFILKWNEKSLEEKRTLYSKYACHELNFFLAHKDPDFFSDVVQPFVSNKLEKQYFDRWLLNGEIDRYREPWYYGQLNVAEQILLGKRLSGELEPSRRHVHELYQISPTSRETYNALFQVAIKGNALTANDPLSLTDFEQNEELYFHAGSELSGLPQNAPARPQSNFGGGGFGGGRGGGGKGGAPAADKAEEARQRNEVALENQNLRQSLGRQMDALREKRAEADDEMAAGERFRYNLAKRDQLQRLYIELEQTKEWAENNYYHLPLDQQVASLIDVNQFWLDYANHEPGRPFYSSNFAEASGSFAEMMLALAVLDLPMEAPDHESQIAEGKLTLQAKGPIVAFHEEIRPVVFNTDRTPILVSQNFFRMNDRYQQDGNERTDKFVTDEFLTHTAYGCQVVVTNPTSSRQKIDVLTQIPVGALPINGGKATDSLAIDLEPYNTQSIEYYFYFPLAGKYDQYPVHVAKDEKLMAFAEAMQFQVVERLSKIDRESWAYISQFGTEDEVLDYLKQHNLLRTDLSKIAFRMKDEAFFQQAIDLVASQHGFDMTLWSYGIKHNDPRTIRDYLKYSDNFVNRVGAYLNCSLVTLDPNERRNYQHLEYRPLVNARTHQLGAKRRILNDRFFAQYHHLLEILKYQPQLDDDSLMVVTYYMLLQDRIEEAMKYFGKVNPDRLATRLQYDYFDAYLAMYQAEPERAKQIAERYRDYAVDRWREAFAAVDTQVTEILGGDSVVVDDEDRGQTQTKLADQLPTFEFQVESKQIQLSYANLDEVHVRYYIMDIELLFSRNPFVQQHSGQFAYIRPNADVVVELPKDKTSLTIDLPESLHTSNVLVEISGAGTSKSHAYYSNSLNIQLQEGQGQLRVSHEETKRPVSTTYVKTYARMKDGTIKFYKDGYTDLRGRFDYTSLSTNELDFVDRFAILIISDEHGAVVREVAPPQQ